MLDSLHRRPRGGAPAALLSRLTRGAVPPPPPPPAPPPAEVAPTVDALRRHAVPGYREAPGEPTRDLVARLTRATSSWCWRASTRTRATRGTPRSRPRGSTSSWSSASTTACGRCSRRPASRPRCRRTRSTPWAAARSPPAATSGPRTGWPKRRSVPALRSPTATGCWTSAARCRAAPARAAGVAARRALDRMRPERGRDRLGGRAPRRDRVLRQPAGAAAAGHQGAFDAVLAVSVWSHFAAGAAERWLAEMTRVMRPGGVLAFTIQGVGSPSTWAARRSTRATPPSGWRNSSRADTPSTSRSAARETGA